MEISNLVVARYVDGRVLKGVTQDFSPNRGIFHVQVDGDSGSVVEVRFKSLKALFFVSTLEGDPSRQDVRGFVDGPAETQKGKKIAVRFRDGEFICGYTLSWTPEREGFFMFPADLSANNQRIFVITASTVEVKAGPAADALAARVILGTSAEAEARAMRVRPWSANQPPRVGPAPPVEGRRPSGFFPGPPPGPGNERRTGSD